MGHVFFFPSGCDTRLPHQGIPQISAECGDADIQVMCLGLNADISVFLDLGLGFPFIFGPLVSFPSADWVSQRFILVVQEPLHPVFEFYLDVLGLVYLDVLGLVFVGFPDQLGMELSLSSGYGLPMQFPAFALFSVARRRTLIATIYPTPLSESMNFTGQTRMATLEFSRGFSTYFKRFASSLAALIFFFLVKEIFSLTTAAPDSSLESHSVSLEFLTQASDYTRAKGADHSGLPPQQ
jgi:hypothetical protein